MYYKDRKQAVFWQCHSHGSVTAFSYNFFCFCHVNIWLQKVTEGLDCNKQVERYCNVNINIS